MMARLREDIALGWNAPPGPLMTGALAALAVAGSAAALMGAFTTIHPGLIAAGAGAVQLGLAYAIAGRLVRRAHDGESR
jgi:hypothetical protein